MADRPVAYFITFTCYGTWVHGRAPGSVDREHNEPGTPYLEANPRREQGNVAQLAQEPYVLDTPRQNIVLNAMRETCAYRGWTLRATHVRTNHIHAVVHADAPPERVMNDLKAYASRALNAAGLDSPDCKRWTRHGSTRYLWTEEDVEACIRYVVEEQGSPLAVFVNDPNRT